MGLDQKNDGKMTDGWKDEESVCAELKRGRVSKRAIKSNVRAEQMSKCQGSRQKYEGQ